MIKYSELQIGDWVSVDGVPRKVEMITKKKIGYHVNKQTDGCLQYARLKDVEQIPLTEGFFRVNGFVKNLCYWEYWIDNQSWLEFYKHENRLSRYWRGVDEWQNHSIQRETTFKCHGIHYVHQLQHALRLCYWEGKDWKYEGI